MNCKGPAEKKTKGTCPCCFRAMTLKGGKVVRHGWKEIGGGYGRGRGWHSGRCFGVSYAPFEVSKAGTEDLLKVLESEFLPAAEAYLKTLKRRPAEITFSYRGIDPETKRYADLIRTLKDDGTPLEGASQLCSGRNKSYAYQLHLKVKDAKNDLSSLKRDVDTLRNAVQTWVPMSII